MKKAAIVALGVVAIVVTALFVWANSVLGSDAVRTALAAQVSKALGGQPVKIGAIGATIFPRVTVTVRDVAIGEPARIRAQTMKVGAAFGALLSRRIEHGSLELSDARVDLPLPSFSATDAAPGASAAPAVQLVSIDGISLRHLQVVSGGRTLSGDVEIAPQGAGLEITRASFSADNTQVDVTGHITDPGGPAGDLAIKARALDLDQLLAFANDFANGAGVASTRGRASGRTATREGGAPMNLTVALDASSATINHLKLEKLAGKARVTHETLALNPIAFGVFGGHYQGSLVFTLGAVPEFRLNAALSNVEVASAVAFAGSAGTMTGRLSGTLTLAGRGLDAASVERAARGTMRVEIVDGTIKNLGLVRTVVVATSGRSDATAAGASRDEPFTKLGATLAIANGEATTRDLRLESKDLLLSASGSIRLDGSAIDLPGQVQLSDDLSKQAGRDLVRYTQEQGRVTLPATVTGTAAAPQVRVDAAAMAKRAVTNRAHDEAEKLLKKGLGGLFKKP
jgi:uncharacterized protein involved in outer membrane biogenesis